MFGLFEDKHARLNYASTRPPLSLQKLNLFFERPPFCARLRSLVPRLTKTSSSLMVVTHARGGIGFCQNMLQQKTIFFTAWNWKCLSLAEKVIPERGVLGLWRWTCKWYHWRHCWNYTFSLSWTEIPILRNSKRQMIFGWSSSRRVHDLFSICRCSKVSHVN